MTETERLDRIQAEYDEIERRIGELRRRLTGPGAGIVVQNGATPSRDAPKAAKKHRISKAGRARIASATRGRWRKARAADRSGLR
jgi:hypothetical protein